MTTSNNKELNYVRFDVGHYLHVCHRSTIKKFENSFLAKLIAPEFDTRKSESDYIVIDRDGKHFASILNYMRDESSLDLQNWTDSDLTDLMREADFYCLVDLVELCERQFESRDIKTQGESLLLETDSFVVPQNEKLEIIYGVKLMYELVTKSVKSTIVISHKSVRRFHIDHWIEELVKLCDYNKFNLYCYSSKDDQPLCQNMKDFIMTVFDPQEKKFKLTVQAPPLDKFKSRRDHYKCKIFKFWFLVQHT